ncbi:MAG: PKD domain-containing protein [Imperialibacter sp.]|uniref:HYR-like domain-containing protein n=1 Tax=Imperialibacter sp. TaxID=2038411 RepID=UPI0032EE32DB
MKQLYCHFKGNKYTIEFNQLNRIAFTILMPAFLFFSTSKAHSQFSGNGAGTEGDPYQITTPAQLDEIREYLTAHFILMNDIDLTTATGDESGGFWNGGEGWQPIAAVTINVNITTPFSGSLDGDEHTITGLYINRPCQDYVGLFGYVNSGAVKNLTLSDVDVTGRERTGALVSLLYDTEGLVENAHVAGSVTGTAYTGGMTGQIYNGTVTQSSSTVAVEGTNQVGGLIGTCSICSVSSSFAAGQVTGSQFIGGLVGVFQNGSITNTYAAGDVLVNQASYTTRAGGLIGSMSSVNSGGATNPSLSYSFATGSVTFNNGDHGNGAIGRDSYAVAGSQVTNVYFDLASCNVLESFSPAETLKTSEMVVGEFGALLANEGSGWVMVFTEGGVYPFFSWEGETGENLQPYNLAPTDIPNPTPSETTLPDLTAQCTYESQPAAPTATDACGNTLEGTTDATFPITSQGETTITWTYTSANGQVATQTQKIIIEDTSAPTPEAETLTAVEAACEVTELTIPTASDNCGGEVTVTHNATLPITAQGTTTITWTYTDQHGNSSTQTQEVIIKDEAAPVPNLSELSNVIGDCDGQVSSIDAPTATDNCAREVTGTTDITFPISTIGETEITWTFDDGNGNTSTQKQTIIIPQSKTSTQDTTICADVHFTFPDGTVGTATGQHVSVLSTTLGCDSTVTTTLTVAPLPSPSLGDTPVFACVGDELAFDIDEANATFESYKISYLEGAATNESLKFVFSAEMAAIAATQGLPVTVEATSAAGCTGTATVYVQDNTMINWGIGVTQVSDPSITISNSTYPETADSWQWDFGDGTTVDNESSPSHTYASNGDYTITLTVSNECGSEALITSVSILNACNLDVPVISQDGNMLTASSEGVTYEWIDCETGTPIGGNTKDFLPEESGSYAVKVIEGTCAEQSACFDFVYEGPTLSVDAEQNSLSVYPNPASSSLTVSLEGPSRSIVNITILSIDGQVVEQLTFGKTTQQANKMMNVESLAPGTYLIRVWGSGHHSIAKFIKR